MRRLHLLRSHKISKALSKQRVSLIDWYKPYFNKVGLFAFS